MSIVASSLRSLANERGTDRDFFYLLTLARKHGVEPIALYNALVEARDKKQSRCGSLSIELRRLRNNTFCFMFSRNDRAVAQTAVSEYSLAKLREVPPEITQLLKDRDRRPKATDCGELERRIADLQVGLRHVNLTARVIDKSEVRAVQSRDGLPLVVCSATLSDGTGQIRLPLWNSQIDSVAKNDTVVIREATVRHFMGEMQLSIPRKTGSISIVH
jgi:replication factor A1